MRDFAFHLQCSVAKNQISQQSDEVPHHSNNFGSKVKVGPNKYGLQHQSLLAGIRKLREWGWEAYQTDQQHILKWKTVRVSSLPEFWMLLTFWLSSFLLLYSMKTPSFFLHIPGRLQKFGYSQPLSRSLGRLSF